MRLFVLLLAFAGALLGALALPVLAADAPSGAARGVEMETELESAMVVVDGRPLFRVAGLATTFPAATRAERIAGRIEALAEDPRFDPARLRAEPTGSEWTIAYEQKPILVLTDGEARIAGVSVADLAPIFRQRIVDAVAQYREDRAPGALRAAATRIAVALVVALAAGFALVFATRFLRGHVERRYRDRVQSVGVQSFQILRAEQIWDAWRKALAVMQAIGVALIVLGLLEYALAQLPWTRSHALGVLALVVDPLRRIANGILDTIPDLVFLAILALVVRYGLQMLKLFFVAVEHGRVELHDFDRDWAMPTYKLLRLVIVVLALVVAYPYIPGSESDAFKGISLFLGLVVSLGSTTAIANTIAGYALIYRRAFKVGDRIKVGDTVGDVTAARLQVTHLRTPRNEEVIVPNSHLLNNAIVNFSALAEQSGVAVTVAAGIGYETPWRQVEAMLLEAARRTAGVLAQPAPFVLHQGLGDFAVNYELYAFVRDAHEMLPLHAALSRNVLDVFNEYGVQIMTPNYVADTPQAKVVRQEDWYLQPARPPHDSPERPATR